MIKHVSYGHKWYIVIFIRIFPIYFAKMFFRPHIVRSTLDSTVSKYFRQSLFWPSCSSGCHLSLPLGCAGICGRAAPLPAYNLICDTRWTCRHLVKSTKIILSRGGPCWPAKSTLTPPPAISSRPHMPLHGLQL